MNIGIYRYMYVYIQVLIIYFIYYPQSIYETQIQLNGLPLLAWDPPPLSSNISANNMMTQPVVTLKTRETVENIVKTLKKYSHNGFPVIEYVHNNELVSNYLTNYSIILLFYFLILFIIIYEHTYIFIGW